MVGVRREHIGWAHRGDVTLASAALPAKEPHLPPDRGRTEQPAGGQWVAERADQPVHAPRARREHIDVRAHAEPSS
eukprot:7388189-Prymnesium_polylepis.2